MKDKDVTGLVDFGNPDDEYLPITKCVCGKKYDMWDESISIYPEYAEPCPECGRRLYFRSSITVYEVK